MGGSAKRMVFISAERGVSKLSTPGHIYFIQAEGGGPIKIGWATKPERRLAGMQPHSPLRLQILFHEPGNGRDEAALHAKFAVSRLHGEWFAPAPEILAEIKRRQRRKVPKEYRAAAPPLERLTFG